MDDNTLKTLKNQLNLLNQSVSLKNKKIEEMKDLIKKQNDLLEEKLGKHSKGEYAYSELVKKLEKQNSQIMNQKG